MKTAHFHIKIFTVFLLGIILLFFRNMDPLLQPAMYTEDGSWVGMALTHGWLYLFLNAKQGYFVWGNLIFLWLSSATSEIACKNQLICLPQAIAFWSYFFFSATATATFFATKMVISKTFRWILFLLIIAMPLGNSANEIIGRISNIGYLMVFWSVLIVYHKRTANNNGTTSYFLDLGLIIISATNPVCIVIIPILATFSSYSSLSKKRLRDLASVLMGDYKFSFIGLFILLIFQIIFFRGTAGQSITGNLDPNNLIEVSVARSLLYPVIFPFYDRFNDAVSLLLLFLFFCAFGLFSKYNRDSEKSVLCGLTGIAILCFLIATVYMRQSLTQQIGNYTTTFPDRYFMGINILVILMIASAFSPGACGASNVARYGKYAVITIFLMYALSVGWLFEINSPRMKIVSGPNFSESICIKGRDVDAKGSNIFLPIYFNGWVMELPPDVFREALSRVNCNYAVNDFYISDANWERGVARRWAGFFVPSHHTNSIKFKAGMTIRFKNGEIRKITSVTQSGIYLNINVEGQILNPEEFGTPSEYNIIE